MLCKKILLAITGPTAIGKTELGIQVAAQLERAEILSVDSRQIYRHMDIGTAKPTAAQCARVKHHFIDILNPDQAYSAGQFKEEARRKIEALWENDKLPVLVGGSGLYLQAVLDGLSGDGEHDPELRADLQRRLEEEGLETLYAELGQIDPVSWSRIEPKDARRVMRALEVARAGQGATMLKPDPLDCIPLLFCVDAEREKLYERIDRRVDQMLARGLVAEVGRLLGKGYGRSARAMGTLGYAEILDFLEGRCSLEEAKKKIKRESRKYAKRQWTWFRRDRRMRWLSIDIWGQRGVSERILAQLAAEETL